MPSYQVVPVEFTREGLAVRGRLYTPAPGEAAAPYPLAICSHGFGGNMGPADAGFGPSFSRAGIAACVFDFCGGRGSTSDGTPTDRSILTEAADLEAVLDGMLARPDIDAARICLFGVSEGGLVSTMVAARRPGDICALACMFPAYCIPEDARRRMSELEDPEVMDIRGTIVGRAYNVDAASVDPYGLMPLYDGPVLIVHGTADLLVDVEYSRRAARTFAHAQLVEVEGMGHGFRNAPGFRDEAFARALAFFRENGAAEGAPSPASPAAAAPELSPEQAE